MPTKKSPAKKRASAKKATKKSPAKKRARAQVKKAGATGRHQRGETMPWKIWVNEHPERTDSPDFVKSRKKMNQLARTVADFYYGGDPYEDHHGGGLWLKDTEGWFIVRNLAGMEWSSQFCADPKKVDELRVNARRIYAQFPEAVKELGIRELLDTPITDADGVARWTDSICNASLPLPKPLHVGALPKPGKAKPGKAKPDEEVFGGVHHYPAPIVDQQLFKYDDYQLWVTYDDKPLAVVPLAERGSGDGRTAVVYAEPGTDLAEEKDKLAARHKPLILHEDDLLSLRAFSDQYEKVLNNKVLEGDPLRKMEEEARALGPRPKRRRVSAARYRLR